MGPQSDSGTVLSFASFHCTMVVFFEIAVLLQIFLNILQMLSILVAYLFTDFERSCLCKAFDSISEASDLLFEVFLALMKFENMFVDLFEKVVVGEEIGSIG